MAPMIAFALLVVMGCVALVLERLWLDSAIVETQSAADAAVIAAGRQLADDLLLRSTESSELRMLRAREAAAEIACANPAAGEPVVLDTAADGDIRFGRLIDNADVGLTQFLETAVKPTTVVVTARRTRKKNNPVAVLFQELTGRSGSDVTARAEATINNRVVGLRPFNGIPIPAMPLAILKHDSTGHRAETWDAQIESGRGEDRYRFDAESGKVLEAADGIPEIVLISAKPGGDPHDANMQMIVDLGHDPQGDPLQRQIIGGWQSNDLHEFGGELRFDQESHEFGALGIVGDETRSALEQMIGHCRICLLYTEHRSLGHLGFGRMTCVQMVAGRVMSVRPRTDGSCEIVFQPGVLTTRTAVLDDKPRSQPSNPPMRNRYIYKLQLTQ